MTLTLSCIKKLSALVRGITSKNIIVWIFFILLEQKNKLESHKSVCESKDVIMPSEDTTILELNQYQKSDKAPFNIYADHECIIEKIEGCKNNPEKSSTTKVSKHIPSGFSMFPISAFRSIENEHDVYRGRDCMKTFCESLRGMQRK